MLLVLCVQHLHQPHAGHAPASGLAAADPPVTSGLLDVRCEAMEQGKLVVRLSCVQPCACLKRAKQRQLQPSKTALGLLLTC